MKLLVSDYDGTLTSNIKNLSINIDAINNFMQSGNKFAIATGREYVSIKNELDNYGINYDYLICNNGLIIFDNKNRIINSLPLTKEDLYFIDSFLKGQRELRNTKYYNFFSSTLRFEEILEIYAKFDKKSSATKYKKQIQEKMTHIGCHQIGKRLFVGNKATKATAISYISSLENIDKENIFTIGDDINDIEMLEEFNGYKIKGCNKKLWFKKIPTVKNVHTLVKKISHK